MSEQTLKEAEDLTKRIVALKIECSNLRQALSSMEQIQKNIRNSVGSRLLENEQESGAFTDQEQISYFMGKIRKCFKGLFFVNKKKLTACIKKIVDDRLIRREMIFEVKLEEKLANNGNYMDRKEQIFIHTSKLEAKKIEIQSLEDDLILLLK